MGNSGKKVICSECHLATYDYIPPDYYTRPPTPSYYRCRLCGHARRELEDE